MDISLIFEFGLCGFGIKRKVFDVNPTKYSFRIAVGIMALTFVYGNAAAIRSFR